MACAFNLQFCKKKNLKFAGWHCLQLCTCGDVIVRTLFAKYSGTHNFPSVFSCFLIFGWHFQYPHLSTSSYIIIHHYTCTLRPASCKWSERKPCCVPSSCRALAPARTRKKIPPIPIFSDVCYEKKRWFFPTKDHKAFVRLIFEGGR